MELVSFENKLDRDIVFLALNSSLFYLYWMTYGDMHHVTKSQIMRFPMPDRSTVEEHKDTIEEYSQELSNQIKEHYSPNTYHQFRLAPAKPLIDEIEENLMGKLYGLDKEQVGYVQNYQIQYRL